MHQNSSSYITKPIIIPAVTGLLLLISGFALMKISALVSGFSDTYDRLVYLPLQETYGRLTGLFPFSVSEFLIIAVLAFAACGVIFVIIKRKLSVLLRFLSAILLLAGLLFFLYAALCGVNYHRTSFASAYGFEAGSYTADDLYDVCSLLTERINEECALTGRDENGVTVISDSAGEEAPEVMTALGDSYPLLSGYYPEAKPFWFSRFLSVQNVTGIYLPFGIEANYNTEMPSYNIPFTMCHELSHLKGFMQEEEANFIAFLACSESDLPEFKYSGDLLAWIYCMNELESYDADSWKALRSCLDDRVLTDLKDNSAFWSQYKEKTATKVHSAVNDTYLKANGQAEGMKSYDRVVGLIVSYLKDR